MFVFASRVNAGEKTDKLVRNLIAGTESHKYSWMAYPAYQVPTTYEMVLKSRKVLTFQIPRLSGFLVSKQQSTLTLYTNDKKVGYEAIIYIPEDLANKLASTIDKAISKNEIDSFDSLFAQQILSNLN